MNTKLRSFIHDMEVKCEGSAGHIASLQQEQAKASERARALHRALQDKEKESEEADNDFRVQLNQVKSACESTKRDLSSEKELHDVLRRHFEALKADYNEAATKFAKADEELKHLKRQKRDTDVEVGRFKDVINKLESDLGNKEEELANYERNAEKMCSNLQELEAQKKQLYKQIKDVEKQLKESLAEYRRVNEELHEIKAENEKVLAIQKMIQKLANEGDVGGNSRNASSAS